MRLMTDDEKTKEFWRQFVENGLNMEEAIMEWALDRAAEYEYGSFIPLDPVVVRSAPLLPPARKRTMARVKFRKDTDEETCGEVIPGSDKDPKYADHGGLACMRTADHDGEHISLLCDAAAADGVCHGCRLPMPGRHRVDCHSHNAKLAQEASDWDSGVKKPTDPGWEDA